jgi:hypothetical protein
MRQGEVSPERREGAAQAAPAQERRPAGAASWQEIKSRFVDDPKGAIAAADELVRLAVEDKIRRLKQEHEELRAHVEGDDASATEQLRTRLIRYQAYFESISGQRAH